MTLNLIEKKFGKFKVAANNEIRVCCFKCWESRYRLYLNTKVGFAYCFNCGFRSTVQSILGTRINLEARPDTFEKQVESIFPELVPLTEQGPRLLWKYAKTRMSEEQIARHKISYIEPNKKELEKYKSRIIFPVTKDFEVVYFQARTVFRKLFAKQKYLNPAATETKLGKREVVFNLDRVSRKSKVCVVCEGILSAMAVPGEMGVGILGKDLSDTQRDLLTRSGIETFIILLDPDTSWETLCVARGLLEGGAKEVRIATLEDGDPADLARENPYQLYEKIDQSYGVNLGNILDLEIEECFNV